MKTGFDEISTKHRKSKLSVDHALDIASTVGCFDVVIVVVVGSEFAPDKWAQERLRDTYLACGSQL
jgi:hypothetical protein